MDYVEIFLLIFYACIIFYVSLFNFVLGKKARQLTKDEVEFILYRENKNLNFCILSSIVGVVIFYVYLTTTGFIITFILMSLLLLSYGKLKSNLSAILSH